MDDTTAGGYPPESVAEQILDGVADEKTELFICPVSNRLAVILRAIWPSLYFTLMEKRAKRTTPQKVD